MEEQSTTAEGECGICLDPPTNAIVLPCKHKFCSGCLDKWRSKFGALGNAKNIERSTSGCPMCRGKIREYIVFICYE